MSEIAARYRKVASEFCASRCGARGCMGQPVAVRGVGGPGHRPAPGGVDAQLLPRERRAGVPDTSVGGRRPRGAWRGVSDRLQAALDDPAVAGHEFESRPGRYSVQDAIDTFLLPDVLVHTWDLGRATGLDERLDADEVHRMVGRSTRRTTRPCAPAGTTGPEWRCPRTPTSRPGSSRSWVASHSGVGPSHPYARGRGHGPARRLFAGGG